MVYWILIADAARARVFSTTGRGAPLHLEHEVGNPLGRAHPSEIYSDELGRYRRGARAAALSAMEPRRSPHEVEEQRFARELAEFLETGLQRQEYDSIAICAPAQLLGLLRQSIGAGVHKRLFASFAKDLTAMDGHELTKHIEALLSARLPE